MKNKLQILFGFCVCLCGMGIFCYPTISSTWNEFVANQLVNEYAESVQQLEGQDFVEEKQKAEAYNQTLERNTSLICETQFEKEEAYEEALNLTKDGVMGYLEIPKIAQKLPIYHYSEEQQLSSGIGHLHGSSLPIGGEGNCVLTGHRGLPSNMLFTRLDEMKLGDDIYLHVLDMDMAYRIKDIYTVLPEEVSNIQIENGKDFITLVTCTPYGINSHRLVLIAERVDYPEDRKELTTMQVINNAVSKWRVYVCLLAIMLVIGALIWKKKRK